MRPYQHLQMVRPAGAPAPTATAGDITAPAPPDAGGRVEGIDGMLDQISAALAKQAGPMIARDLWPLFQADTAMQERMAAAAGEAAAAKLRPWIALAAGSIAVYVAVKVLR